MLSERIKGFAGDEERGWIGKDVSLQKNILINPHGIRVARLATQPGSFPFELKEGAEERFSASMRSRYAQIGLHPADDSLEYALESYFNAQDTDSFEFPFAITNFSNAPIFIPRGTEMLRFYVPPVNFVENGNLEELIRDKTVQIDGREGREWNFVYRTLEKNRSDIVGIGLKVKEGGRKYIPKQNEPISVSGSERNYRKEVDRFLVPVEERKDPQIACLWIGETSAIDLGNRVSAEIERNAYPGFQGNSLSPTTGEHINSRLIDPSTGWAVRVEIFSPTAGEHVADWVVFRFFNQ